MPDTALVEQRIDNFVRVGKQERALRGWNYDAVHNHLRHHLAMELKQVWCDVDCASRTFLHIASDVNRRAVRKKLRQVQRNLIAHGQFLVVEYAPRRNGHHGEAQRFKLYEGVTEGEREAALEQLDGMRRRGEIASNRYDTARSILEGRASQRRLEAGT